MIARAVGFAFGDRGVIPKERLVSDSTDSRRDPVQEVREHLEQALALLDQLRAGTSTVPDQGAEGADR